MQVSQKDLQRINQAVEYSEQHLSNSISLLEMARQVNMSEFHFHRVFKAVTNETFNTHMSLRGVNRQY